ncbi:rhamnulokinase family protein [Arthrobacter sp. zg-Y820]|uniref:rhamnulokinase n=1 Tax=unclassified Arthrobacter TaxID=235627 RepID=UPI001E4536A9|nr:MULTISPECIES: rhamnulokinase family protein [unclassified Arthrobacter]MCC9196514.1 rhamnulokinase [Arthrobacter sp. zg-Y820]MDK1279376.1 rhamnulokinase family protein [Arthrobacter sp. zg.Y820]WIB08240.1 rhamnulokinase family protein [Arthrobacter sp. zg-Y820]
MNANTPDTRTAAGVFAAVDIGASSGRVILGRMGPGGPALETVHRFPNGVREIDGALRWDLRGIFDEVLTGLSLAAARTAEGGERIVSIGIDTWAVDYGLIDADGAMATLPHSYRDGRTAAVVPLVHEKLAEAALYATTGLQHLPFNTLYQLACESELAGRQALLIPDLLAFWLTGKRRTEETNASTTGLFDAVAGEWAPEFLSALGLPANLFPELIAPGQTVGVLLPAVAERTGLPAGTPVVAVGSHDTASAVAAVPALQPGFAYISSGTWSLAGIELAQPVLTEASRSANFTNERGVDATIRYLRNVGGLWLLSESMRTWAEAGVDPELPDLLAAAAQLPPGGPLIDVDADEFIAPGQMPGRIRAAVTASGGVLPEDPAAVTRCILDSLAAAYARTLSRAAELSGQDIDVVHIVGGGSQNSLLCQLTADATGLPVIAGPVEATALGNVLVQARAAGAVSGSLADLRRLVAESSPTVTYRPAARPLRRFGSRAG